MEKIKWLALRGLVRGNGHWGRFPDLINKLHPEVEIEYLELPGNGTRYMDSTPLDARIIINDFRQKYMKSLTDSTVVKVNFIGISLGGMIGLKWLELYPDDFQNIIIINSSLKQLSSFSDRLKPNSYSYLLKAVFTKNILKREQLILKIMANLVSPHSQEVLDNTRFSEAHPIQFQNFIRQLILANKIKINLNKINNRHKHEYSKPEIKIICAKKDKLVNYNCSKKIADALKINLTVHPSAGHDIILDDPKWIIEQIF